MTTKYQAWLNAYSAGTFDVTNVDMNCRLVTEDYVPDVNHTPTDVEPYIIKVVSVLVEDFFSSNQMGSILDLTKERLQEGLYAFPYEVGLEIDRVFPGEENEEKREKIKQLIQSPDPMHGDLWRELKENGIKYLVFESLAHGVLTFCEEID